MKKILFDMLTKYSTAMANNFDQIGPKMPVSSPRCMWLILTKRQRPMGAVAANQVRLTFFFTNQAQHVVFSDQKNLHLYLLIMRYIHDNLATTREQ